MSSQPSRRSGIDRIQRISAAIGILGLIACVVSWFLDSGQLYAAWLMAWFYWLSVAIGCLGFFMIYRITGGEWGKSLERVFIAGGLTFELLVLLFLPLLASFSSLYTWAHPEIVRAVPELIHKRGYLNIPAWIGRSFFFLACWAGLSRILLRVDKENARRWSAGGIILITITISFAAVDWIMSLEPLWYSTVYGLIILTGQGIVGLSFALVVMHFLAGHIPEWNPPLTHKVLKDQGSLLLTVCILWTYVSFVQWLIIWIGNIPETVTWYASRAEQVWQALAWTIFIGQFLIPFQLLIWQRFKSRTTNLAGIGIFLLVVHGLEVYWLVEPAFHPESMPFNWVVIFSWMAIGGIWVAWFLHNLKNLSLASAANDFTPRLRELIHV